MSVEFIARITCSVCGAKTEVRANATCNPVGGYSPMCRPEMEHDWPDGWFAYEGHETKCLDCWTNNKSPRSPEGEGGQE